MKALTVVATIQAKVEHVTKVREQLLTLIEPSRADEGCIRYELAEGEGGSFVFTEQWTSKQALDDHLAQPHVQDVLGVFGELVDEVEVKELEHLA